MSTKLAGIVLARSFWIDAAVMTVPEHAAPSARKPQSGQ